ncbi:MAG: [FeFe] hydrogenase H-cluster radical SAM maturase HydE [Fidelibacterota bacterium]
MKKYFDILQQNTFSKADIIRLLRPADPAEQKALFQRADSLTRSYFGSGVYLRGIIELSNVCRRNCAYCGIRAGNSAVKRYRMTLDEIRESTKKIKAAGIDTVVLQSGEDPENTPEYIEKMIRAIRADMDIVITLSLGEYPVEAYRRWHNAGAERYLLKFESSDRNLYRRLHPDCDFDERWQCLKDIRCTGYQLGSGFMVGLPGQSTEMLADDLLALAALEPDMAGIGPFIPHPQTPMGNSDNSSTSLALNVLAVARLVLKDTHLPTTTALETLEKDSRLSGMKAGANVIMPNFTPKKYKKLYEIYPEKAGSADTAEHAMETIARHIRAAGKHIEYGYGHSIKAHFSHPGKA